MTQKRKPRARAKANTHSKSSFPNLKIPSSLLWLLLGITIGMLVYSVFLDKSKKTTFAKTTSTIPKINKKTSVQQKATSYDFYKILPKGEQERKPTKTSKKKKTLSLKYDKLPSNKYMIQVGSFLKFTDTEELKARLTLSGYTPIVKKANLNNKTWYRIQLGPFNSKDLALKQQKLLSLNNIRETLIVKN